ncbi:MAG: hypothetical protein IJ880_16445 [Bacilli bacterium]|nr:hypothetical protein [Bacilli bacterium]
MQKIININKKSDIIYIINNRNNLEDYKIILIDNGYQNDIRKLADTYQIEYQYILLNEIFYTTLENMFNNSIIQDNFNVIKQVEIDFNEYLIDYYLLFLAKLNNWTIYKTDYQQDIWINNLKETKYIKYLNKDIDFNTQYLNNKSLFVDIYTEFEIKRYQDIMLLLQNWDNETNDVIPTKQNLKLNNDIMLLVKEKNEKRNY